MKRLMILCITAFCFSSAVYADTYEPDDDVTKAKIIVLEKSQAHSFDKIGDTDWVKFYAFAEQLYKIRTLNLSSNCDTRIELYNIDGIILLQFADDGIAGKEELIEWKCPKNGVYYVKVKNADPNIVVAMVNYDLVISQPTAPYSGRIEGTVRDSVSRLPVGDVIITTTQRRSALSSPNDGYYDMENHPADNYTLIAEADGYQLFTVSGTLSASGVAKHDILLCPLTVKQGDLNGDHAIDLKDVILALKILAGLSETCCDNTDINGDNRIGMEDVIYILQSVAELR